MNLTETLSAEHSYHEMSCFTVMQVDFEHRCDLSMQITHCHFIMNFFNYFEIMYCSINIQSKMQENFVMAIFVIFLIYLMLMTMLLIDKFITPALKILSLRLSMTEYVAGVTLLCLGNSLPDLIVNTMPIRGHSPLYTISLSNAMAVVLLSGGMICFLRPFKIDGHSALRDLLYLLFSGETLVYMIFSDRRTTQAESILLILMYFGYLFIIFADLNLLRMTIRRLNWQIKRLQSRPYSPSRRDLINKKLEQLNNFELEAKMVVFNYSNIYRSESQKVGAKWRISMTTAQIRAVHHVEYDVQATGQILYNPSNPRNMFLFKEFLWSLMPINLVDWKLSGWIRRTYQIILSPVALICVIFIPVVDYRLDKHGWSKLLNCTQIITNPLICFALIEAMINNTYTEMYLDVTFNDAIYSMYVTVPLALVVLFHSRTDRPPPYHMLFLVLTVTSSLLFLTICSTEVEVLFVIIGLVFQMTEDFLASSVRSAAGALNDVLFNVHLAMQGYEKMAFAASLAAPIFGVTVCMGVPCLFNPNAQHVNSVVWIFGENGENAQVFFMLAIFTALAWTLTFNFVARRSIGIFSYMLFLLYILYNSLGELDIIHEISKDKIFQPV